MPHPTPAAVVAEYQASAPFGASSLAALSLFSFSTCFAHPSSPVLTSPEPPVALHTLPAVPYALPLLLVFFSHTLLLTSQLVMDPLVC